ncbi:hypothetical protein ABZ707_18075 [Streptomyces sp. NPDC006923]|uniref:WXG100-like domain-containing protein n=1 Tax=Streptomyces sp. NPDC006923 TaxID=3155355 RepID=UPI00340649B4
MGQEDTPGSFGFLNPGGRPAVQQQYAGGWDELSARLQEHRERLETLASEAPEYWQDDSATIFLDQVRTLAESGAQAVEASAQAAQAQQEHAGRHAQVLEIIKQLLIQIAATLAFIAAATVFPLLLAVAEAQLLLLVQTAGRVVGLLVRFLSTLVRSLSRVQAALEQAGKLTFRGEGFSFGYGRLLVDGGRDFAIDLMANTTTNAILHKPLDPGQLFTSAGISLGVGGVMGALEGSGVKKLLTGAGQVKRGPDGLPLFRSFSDQYKGAVNSLGVKPGVGGAVRATRPPAPASAGTSLLDDAGRARARVLGLGFGVDAAAGERLTAGLAAAADLRNSTDLALKAAKQSRRDAEAVVRTSETEVRSAAVRLADAEGEVSRWQATHDIYRDSPNVLPDWIREAEQGLSGAKALRGTRERELADLGRTHERSQDALAAAQRSEEELTFRLACAAEQHRVAEADLTEWQDMAAAAQRARTEVPLSGQLSYALQKNAWRQGFGSAKGWREYVLYEGVKDFTKGFTSGLVQSGISAAEGKTGPGSIWRDALMGGTGGAVRGMIKGKFGNIVFPTGGVEEMLWKTGTKGLDKFVRDQIKQALEPSTEAA